MKVIDLLNKIANGEEKPKKVRYDDEIYDTETSNNFSLMIYEAMGKMCSDSEVQLFLNDEVEIIEDKKIKRIQSCGDNLYSEYIGQWLVNKENYTEYDELLMNKINEIIDYLEEIK